jgi:PRC-barrel domain
MPNIDTVRSWQGATLVDRDGSRVGTIDAIYVDDQTGEPEWALVNTGLFGTKSSFVPLAQASGSGDQVQVPYEKQLVKDAPGSTPTSTCRRPKSSSCGSTTASTMAPAMSAGPPPGTPTPPTGTATASMTRSRTPPWATTPRARPQTTP